MYKEEHLTINCICLQEQTHFTKRERKKIVRTTLTSATFVPWISTGGGEEEKQNINRFCYKSKHYEKKYTQHFL